MDEYIPPQIAEQLIKTKPDNTLPAELEKAWRMVGNELGDAVGKSIAQTSRQLTASGAIAITITLAVGGYFLTRSSQRLGKNNR